jgi:hypothetical protein
MEQSLDAELIEKTRQQIRAMMTETARLARTDVAPEEFYSQFLQRLVSSLVASGGVVWVTTADGGLTVQYQINLQEARLQENEERLAQHNRLLQKVLAGDEDILVLPHSGPGVAGQNDAGQADAELPAANPTDFLLLFGRLKTDLETVGVVEIFQRPDAGLATQQGYLRFVTQMCELAGDFLKSHQLRRFSSRQTLWTQLEDFTRVVHASLDPRETAYAIANEGRRLLECDRVSVAIRRGQRCAIEAVSGQDLFDKRSNTVRLLGRLATAVVKTGEALWYAGDARDLAPQVEKAVQAYVDDSHTKMIAVLPLQRPAPPKEDDPKRHVEQEPPVGALIVELIEDARPSPALVECADVVCRHGSAAMANAMEHQNLFLLPVWRALGKTRVVLEARALPKTLGIAGGVLAMVLVFAIWPARLMLESKGSLEPALRQDVFAALDGTVDEIGEGVDHGKHVRRDQPLLLLRNSDLEVAMADIQGQRQTTKEQIDAKDRQSNNPRLTVDDRTRINGELAEAKRHLETLEAQWTLYQKKQAELNVQSPIGGEIVTWDLRNRLIHRPVQRGQALLRVADPAGPWQLELHMPENNIGHVLDAQRKADAAGERLNVSYILATEPGTTLRGKVREIHRIAEVRGDEGNTVLIKVDLDPTEMSQLRDQQRLRPGAGVTAKIDCGSACLGYVLLHDLFDFIQAKVFFKFF